MTFPNCPTCGTGHLLPMSRATALFSFWVCSAPSCGYVISGNEGAVRYFKGEAAQEGKVKGEKRWTDFDF